MYIKINFIKRILQFTHIILLKMTIILLQFDEVEITVKILILLLLLLALLEGRVSFFSFNRCQFTEFVSRDQNG